MKKNSTKLAVFLGIICAVFTAGASWHAVVFNDSRFITPMKFFEYSFRMRDLPMIISGALLLLYILYLLVLLARRI